MATGLVWDERFAWFDAGRTTASGAFLRPVAASDTPASKERIRELLVASGLAARLVAVPAVLASEDDLRRVHSLGYLRRLRRLSDGDGGPAGPDAFIGKGGYDVARFAAGGCIEAVRAVVEGRVDNAYALVRPCGHHATRESGAGFSILSNVAIAVRHAKARLGVGRVAVVDWDVHHGNGTQDAFYADPSVLTISLHQDGAYPPGSGAAHETGEGEARGTNVNLPLPPAAATARTPPRSSASSCPRCGDSARISSSSRRESTRAAWTRSAA